MELARNILTAVLGSPVVKVAQEFRATGPLQISQVRKELDACFERGLVDGIAIINEQLTHRSQQVTAFTQQLSAVAS
jgi:hypothetical protein